MSEEDKKSKSNLGKYLIEGGPGRTPGSLNKYTQMKHDLVQAWKTSEGKKRFLEMLNSKDRADFKWAVERIISILPKETILDGSDAGMPTIVFQFIKNEKVETIEIKQNKPINGGN